MPFITDENLPTVQNVAEGQPFSVDIPPGWTYHDLILAMGGTDFDETHLFDLKWWVNGRVQQHWRSGTELDKINQFDRYAAQAGGLLRLSFERKGLDLREARERTLFGTGLKEHERAKYLDPKHPDPIIRANYDPVPVTSSTLTGTITGSTAPTLSVRARRSAPRPTSVLLQVRNFHHSIGGSGPYEISSLPQDDPLSRVIFTDTSGAGDISQIELLVDNFSVFKRTAAQNNQVQTDGVRTPIAGKFIYDPAEDGAGNNAPPITRENDVRWLVTTTGAVELDIQFETIGNLRA